MKADQSNITKILEGQKQFIIPVYQRIYSWGREECKLLWDDMADMIQKGKDGHFIGSIVNIGQEDDSPAVDVHKYVIIDGQQRLTTLMLLLIALRNYLKENPEMGASSSVGGKGVTAAEINSLRIKNQFVEGPDMYKLVLTEGDRDTLFKLVDERELTPEEKESNLWSNYQLFYSRIKQGKIPALDIYRALAKLQIVNISLNVKDDAQAIFESLNSTGKALSESDLIRNYVLMGLDTQTQASLYTNFWRPMEKLFAYQDQSDEMDEFFRNYLTLKRGEFPRKGRVYETFKSWAKDAFYSQGKTARDLCADLLKYARAYTDVIYLKGNPALKPLYEEVVSLDMGVSYPLLMEVLVDYSENRISEDTVKSVFEMCISYIVRRRICEYATNSHNKTFARLAKEAAKASTAGDVQYTKAIGEYLKKLAERSKFPGDDEFKKAFVERDIYRMDAHGFNKYVLLSLENDGRQQRVLGDDFSIEHIMPQNENLNTEWKDALGPDWKNIHNRYLHTIGNLTLTDKRMNPSMGDRWFVEKRDMPYGYKQSALRLNTYVIRQDTWNAANMDERADELAQVALNVWKYPA